MQHKSETILHQLSVWCWKYFLHFYILIRIFRFQLNLKWEDIEDDWHEFTLTSSDFNQSWKINITRIIIKWFMNRFTSITNIHFQNIRSSDEAHLFFNELLLQINRSTWVSLVLAERNLCILFWRFFEGVSRGRSDGLIFNWTH